MLDRSKPYNRKLRADIEIWKAHYAAAVDKKSRQQVIEMADRLLGLTEAGFLAWLGLIDWEVAYKTDFPGPWE